MPDKLQPVLVNVNLINFEH